MEKDCSATSHGLRRKADRNFCLSASTVIWFLISWNACCSLRLSSPRRLRLLHGKCEALSFSVDYGRINAALAEPFHCPIRFYQPYYSSQPRKAIQHSSSLCAAVITVTHFFAVRGLEIIFWRHIPHNAHLKIRLLSLFFFVQMSDVTSIVQCLNSLEISRDEVPHITLPSLPLPIFWRRVRQPAVLEVACLLLLNKGLLR